MSLKPSLLGDGSSKGEADIAWRIMDNNNRNKNNMNYTAEVTAAALTATLAPRTS